MISLRAHFFALEHMSMISSVRTFQKSGLGSSPGISMGLKHEGRILHSSSAGIFPQNTPF